MRTRHDPERALDPDRCKRAALLSIALLLAPNAPPGKESNWVPTKPGGEFEVLFRFYGPEKPLFEKTWKLPDIERLR